MESEVQEMKGLRDRVGQQGRTRCMVSEELVKMMEGGLVVVKVKRGKRTMVRQREWETAVQIEGLPWGRVEKEIVYVEKRRTYKKTVSRAKRSARDGL